MQFTQCETESCAYHLKYFISWKQVSLSIVGLMALAAVRLYI